ncbi:MAG: hypothetical protein JNL80_01730 [Phycisphaerae bacterium]|nr:hypothetical protein [Phycisphaerae bacterium]
MTVGLQPIDGVELGFELVWSDPDHRQKPKRRLPPFDGTPQPIPVPTPFASASIRRIEEIVPAMMDYDKLVARLDAIDFECYDDLLRTYMCPLEVVAERLRHFPSTSRLIVAEDGVRIVGYWSVFPLLDKEIARTQHGGGTWNPYREFREGRAYDESLTIDLVPNLAIGGRFKAYIQSVCLLPRYRRCAKLLYESILDAIREFAEEDVYFDEVCAHGWKETGNRLCSDFDMTPVADHFSGEGRMFARALHPLPELRIVKRATRLCELYDAEFGSGR